MILPVFNVARYVRESIHSVLSQSWTDLELLAIDDGSTDGTVREIEQIGDGRVSLLRQEHRGPASARNNGLRHARGEFIAFLDGDDVWVDGKLAQDVAQLVDHPEIDLVFAAMRMVDAEGRDLGRTVRRWNGVITLRELLIENIIGTGTVTMRRSACERTGWFDEELPAAADYDYWLRVALLRPSGVYGSERVSMLHRRRPGQLTRDWKLQERAALAILAKARSRCPEQVDSVQDRAEANLYRALSAAAYEIGELQSAVRLFRTAMSRAPAFLLKDKRTWLHASALLSRCVLPRGMHEKLEALVRTSRASRL